MKDLNVFNAKNMFIPKTLQIFLILINFIKRNCKQTTKILRMLQQNCAITAINLNKLAIN